ncbi:MAG: AtpZ/AtpI family protein [Fervidobacterium sp.]|uniref:AtpZ/AtpI family protein n=1 Tax=Fervidobacterium sp. TaxID=1871331 RepID=UPI0040491C2A
MKKDPKKQSIGKELSQLNLISTLGFTIISNVIVGYVIGAFLDRLFNLEKILTVVFLIIGTISGIYNGIRFVMKAGGYDKIDKDKDR